MRRVQLARQLLPRGTQDSLIGRPPPFLLKLLWLLSDEARVL